MNFFSYLCLMIKVTDVILKDKIFAKNDKLFRINSKGITTNFVVKDFNDKVLNLSSENDAVLWHSTTHLNIGREELLNGFWFIQK